VSVAMGPTRGYTALVLLMAKMKVKVQARVKAAGLVFDLDV